MGVKLEEERRASACGTPAAGGATSAPQATPPPQAAGTSSQPAATQPLVMACGNCGKQFGVPPGAKTVKCPHCGSINDLGLGVGHQSV